MGPRAHYIELFLVIKKWNLPLTLGEHMIVWSAPKTRTFHCCLPRLTVNPAGPVNHQARGLPIGKAVSEDLLGKGEEQLTSEGDNRCTLPGNPDPEQMLTGPRLHLSAHPVCFSTERYNDLFLLCISFFHKSRLVLADVLGFFTLSLKLLPTPPTNPPTLWLLTSSSSEQLPRSAACLPCCFSLNLQ